MKILPENLFHLIFLIPFVLVMLSILSFIFITLAQKILHFIEILVLLFMGENGVHNNIKFALLPISIDGQTIWMKKYYFVSVWAYGASLHSGGYSKIVARRITPFSYEEKAELRKKHQHIGKSC